MCDSFASFFSIGTSSDNAIALGIKINPNRRDSTSGTEDFRFGNTPSKSVYHYLLT